jgi:hypothetical protein
MGIEIFRSCGAHQFVLDIFLSRIGVNLGPHPRLLTWLVVIAGLLPVMNALLGRAAFHYSLGGQFLVVRQGILSPQERSISYGVIQNLSIHQDVSRDRGEVEAASPSLLALPFMSRMGRVYAASPQARAPQLGFYGNKVRIAGLSVSDAETLKEMFLQKKDRVRSAVKRRSPWPRARAPRPPPSRPRRTHDDPSAGTPIHYDELRIEHDQGDAEIVVSTALSSCSSPTARR